MFLAKSTLRGRRPLAKTLKLAVWAFSLNFLHVSTLFVIDIHQNMPISLILTPFDHFQICLTFAVTPSLILGPRQMHSMHELYHQLPLYFSNSVEYVSVHCICKGWLKGMMMRRSMQELAGEAFLLKSSDWRSGATSNPTTSSPHTDVQIESAFV